MRGTAVCGCPARHATACDARYRSSIGPNVGPNKHAQRRRGSIASPQALSLGHVELRLRTMATPVASLAGVGLFAETHVGTVARQIAVVPISDAGPALASVAVIFEAVPEVLDLKRDVSARASVLAGPKPIIASTTSTMMVDEMAGEVERPARFLTAHWLNPAYLVPLVELSPASGRTAQFWPRPRSRRSPGTACATCARSSAHAICNATERWPRARSASWKWVMRGGSPR